MINKEQEIREAIAVENQCLAKLDVIRNELLPFYGNMTLLEVEDCLWDQYLKFHRQIRNLIYEKQTSEK